MERLTLYEEYRLIERTEAEVNGVWKGAHLLLFFLAFVFGSFCTFCFHMLMYLFDEKCVLFPKLLSLTSLRQTIIYEFIPDDKEAADRLPVEFLSTQWVEKSACLLPTYVPLVSGIFGLVWTTMFLMCSTGSRVLTGLQRPWRVLPPVFLFSLAMGGLCIYTTAVTHYGLQELCIKLSEITGSTTCTYTVNVATLAYERRIRGVYQATRLTIYSAWLHTACWILSALLAFFRVIFAIDFKLVKITVQLKGNLDRMLERQETHIRTISPEPELKNTPLEYTSSAVHIHFKKKDFQANYDSVRDIKEYSKRDDQEDSGNLLFYSPRGQDKSERSLLPSSPGRLDQLQAHDNLTEDEQFIAKMLDNVLDNVIDQTDSTLSYVRSLESRTTSEELSPVRQYGQQILQSRTPEKPIDPSRGDQEEATETVEHVKRILLEWLHNIFIGKNDESVMRDNELNNKLIPDTELTSEIKDKTHFVPEDAEPGPSNAPLKSSLKRTGVQTEKTLSVQIDSKTSIFTPTNSKSRIDKEDKQVQTTKDKQD
ncbi:uncharacterized protein LOC116773240 [Danaus plexippus]|uniref:uncharacterized protein LOC116773240 n=1 Tax=Danaus plexippus TaxID=13037 RepID=UPI002AAFF41F|nr:uncharacterized protein LOC116773240 [Danaus plexippus]